MDLSSGLGACFPRNKPVLLLVKVATFLSATKRGHPKIREQWRWRTRTHFHAQWNKIQARIACTSPQPGELSFLQRCCMRWVIYGLNWQHVPTAWFRHENMAHFFFKIWSKSWPQKQMSDPWLLSQMYYWSCVEFSSSTARWIQGTQSPDCKRTFHLHLKNSLCTHCETCCYLEQPLYLSVIPLFLSLCLSPSLSLWLGVNLSSLLPADSCAWLSGSLFMRSLHLSPAAASVTPRSSPCLLLPLPSASS